MKPLFDWHLLPTLLAIADHGSLLAAARHLGLSQPTVGRQLAELERQWGAVLFERTARGLQATASAHQLLPHARRMAEEAASLERALQQSHTEVAGSVRISASQPVACMLLPPVVAQLQGTLPDIQIELVADNAVSNLLEREADIALRMLRHADVYQRAEDVAKPDAVFTPSKRTPEDDERDKEDAAQDIRDAITQMDKVGLKTYIKTNWQQDIDGRLSVEAMRQKASALFDQFGLP